MKELSPNMSLQNIDRLSTPTKRKEVKPDKRYKSERKCLKKIENHIIRKDIEDRCKQRISNLNARQGYIQDKKK